MCQYLNLENFLFLFWVIVMGTGVEYVRNFCKKKGVAISKLEKDLGYGNGYLNPKKIKKIEYDRAVEIANYLGCDLNRVLGKEPKTVMLFRPEGFSIQDAAARSVLDEEEYYAYKETKEIAQEIFDDKDLHALFDAARGSRPEDLQLAKNFLLRLKESNPDG